MYETERAAGQMRKREEKERREKKGKQRAFVD